MPHDRNGQKLEKGDRVRIPVGQIHTYEVLPNPEIPEETATAQIQVRSPGPMELEGTITELYESEDACNAQFEVEGAPYPYTFNTRLVEKVEI